LFSRHSSESHAFFYCRQYSASCAARFATHGGPRIVTFAATLQTASNADAAENAGAAACRAKTFSGASDIPLFLVTARANPGCCIGNPTERGNIQARITEGHDAA
jgi:hypothetical protein